MIDRAALACGKGRTDVILEASRRAAEEALLDQGVTRVGAGAFVEFQAWLDAPPNPNERLIQTMRIQAPWKST